MGSFREEMNKVRDDIRQWVINAIDAEFEVIYADRSDPRPDPPYVVISFLTGLKKVGSIDEQVPQTTTAEYSVISRRNISLSIEGIGKPDDDPDKWVRGTDILEQIRSYIDLPTSQAFFKAKNLSLRVDNGINDISKQLDTETEPRARLDIILGLALKFTDDPGYIDTVGVSGAFDTDHDGDFDDIVIPETQVTNE